MANGLIIRGADSSVLLDSSKMAWNVVEYITIPAGTTVTRPYPSLSGLTVVAMQVTAQALQTLATPYAKDISVTDSTGYPTLTVSGGNFASTVLVFAR